MKKVKLLGSTGFIGSNVVEILRQSFCITEERECDVLVNCAGFSKMYEGSKNPDKMRMVENSIFDKINNISFEQLIHLSTIYIDIYPSDVYCLIKKALEENVLCKYKNVAALRLGGVIGRGLKKNVVYDIVNDKPLFVTSDSTFNLIMADEIGRIIAYLINNPTEGVINVGSSESISVINIANLAKKKPFYGFKKENVSMNIDRLNSFFDVKTSENYVKEFLTMCL